MDRTDERMAGDEQRAKVLHRGSAGEMAKFAPRFLLARMSGFEKDMKICLAPVPSMTHSGWTHACFPAFMSCCGTLEYLAGLYAGHTDARATKQDSAAYAKRFLP